MTLQKTKEWLTTPSIQPYRVLVAFIGIGIVIFMDTDLYNSFPDLLKAGLYGGLVVICVLTRFSMVDLKEFAKRMRVVYEDKSMSLWEKIQAYTKIGMDAFLKAGENWEIYTDQQFELYRTEVEKEKEVEIEILKAEIVRLQKEIENN